MRLGPILLVALVIGVARGDDASARERKVRELLDASGAVACFGDTVLEAFLESRGVDPAARAELRAEFLRRAPDLLAPVYLKQLDDTALEAALAFHRTPEGAKLAAAQQAAVVRCLEAADRLVPRGDARRAAARSRCKEYYDLCQTWRVLRGKLPGSLKELEGELNPGDGPFAKVEDDPWGHAYLLRLDGTRPVIVSAGADGAEGSADDIRYPEGAAR
jgi:hypothetical protein